MADAGAAEALDRRILAAHAAGDRAALARLYEAAAEHWLATGNEPAGAFFLTQAYVYALEDGSGAAAGLRARLFAMGRDIPPAGSARD